MSNRQNIQNIAAVEDAVQQQHQLYNRKVDEVQQLLEELKENLEQAKNDLRSAVRGPPLLLPGTFTDSLMKTFDLCLSSGRPFRRCSSGFRALSSAPDGRWPG